jgi:hypothetical protein
LRAGAIAAAGTSRPDVRLLPRIDRSPTPKSGLACGAGARAIVAAVELLKLDAPGLRRALALAAARA